jgi:RNA polymerase sigma factor (TIGR02999 family)
MSANPAAQITVLLNRASTGERESYERLAELVYGELRRMASQLMVSERRNHTLQPTVIASEAYLRLIDQPSRNWQNRAHFFAVAAQAMRRILVDHGRRRQSRKRWGALQRVNISEAAVVTVDSPEELLALDEVLTRLEKVDRRQSRIVELRYFGGLTEEEVAEVLGVSPRTVKREWSFARLWLHAELTASASRTAKPGAETIAPR